LRIARWPVTFVLVALVVPSPSWAWLLSLAPLPSIVGNAATESGAPRVIRAEPLSEDYDLDYPLPYLPLLYVRRKTMPEKAGKREVIFGNAKVSLLLSWIQRDWNKPSLNFCPLIPRRGPYAHAPPQAVIVKKVATAHTSHVLMVFSGCLAFPFKRPSSSQDQIGLPWWPLLQKCI